LNATPQSSKVNDVVESLRTLVGEARDQMRRLSEVLAYTRQGESEAGKSIAQLQDRLRVSAQMLKAFQVQIGRVETSLAAVTAQERRAEAAEERIQQRMAEFDARIEHVMVQLDRRIEESVRAAMGKINRQWDERAADATARRSAVPADDMMTVQAELDQLAATMQDVARHIASLAATSSSPTSIVPQRTADLPAEVIEPKPASIDFVHIHPPLQRQSMAQGAD
jgi:chromosome segregation ATPase